MSKAKAKVAVKQEEEEEDVEVEAEETEDAEENGAEENGDEENEDEEADAQSQKSSQSKKSKQSSKKSNARNKKADKAKSKKKAVKVVRRAEKQPAGSDDGDNAAADDLADDMDGANLDDEVKDDGYRHCTGVLTSRPTAKDVKISNFAMAAYGHQLILDAVLEFSIGQRYGLIGPNGSGKSSLLRALANREVPIPHHIDIFLLEEEAKPSDMTALETVIASVEEKMKIYEEEAEKAIEEFGPDSDIVTDLYARLEDLDPTTFKARAGKILFGLGFDNAMMEKKTKDMSGGWRMRVALAQALFAKPTLLLLDEPTNHLDLEACVWLENYLSKYDRCLVVVSHSQDFLNGVCTNIIHITPKRKLQVYGGNYDTFVQVKTENETNQMKRYKKEQEDIKHIKSFIASCGTYSNLVRQGKSKQKIIDKMVAAGGLVSAMKGVKAASMTWVGWPGTEIAESEQPTIVAKCKEINSFPVFLPKDMAELYYNGFSNHVLWPLFHYIHVNIEDTVDKLDKQWRAYIEANKLFCNAVLQVYEEGDIVWVHDYHLMLLPQFLRAARPNMRIGWFLHTPFPSSEIYRALPYREELLNGVLAADLLGFHIFDYGRHFKSACTRILGLEVTHQGVEHHGRFTQVGTFPIGIDAARFLAALEEEEVQREFADLQRKFKGMKVLLGIDRLDYIKGIPHKLLAVEKFLQHHPEWIGKVVLIQIAVPSRETVIEYQRLKSLTHELVGRVNGRFGTLESVPIHYLDQSVPFPKMCALYRLADLAIITSLRDGMNLVSYEYVVCQKGKNEAGVLILSEFAGAAQSLGAGSIRVNPWNTNQLAHAINQALQMPRDERNHLHQYAFGHITSYTAQRWAQQFIGELNNVCERVSTQLALVGNRWIAPRLVTEDVVSAFQQSRNRVVCLGVVGCLTQKRMRGVTVEQFGQMAQVPQETLDAIDRLSSDPNTTVLIMSALGRSVVDRLLGGTQAWLIPENGFFIRKGGRDSQWEALGDNVDLSWIDEVEEVLNYFVQRTPRSFIEREESYLSWHYRDSDSEWAKLQVRDLLVHLMATPASSHGFEVVRGVKAIQIRPIGVSKGFAAQHCISEVQSVRDAGVDFILCVGSFLFRDEDLFTSLLHYPAPGADKAELMEDPEADLGMVNEDSALQLHSGAEVDDHEPGPTALGGSDGGDSPSVNSITPTSLSHSPITQHIITSSYLPPLALPSIAASPEPAPVLPQPAPVQAQTPSRPEGESSSEQQGAQSDKAEAASSSESRQLGRSHSVFTFRGAQQQGAGTRAAPPTNALGTSFPSPRSYRAINSSASKDHAHSAKRHVFTCTVGRNKPSRAQFHVNGLHDVSNLLQRLAATIPSPPPSAAASSAPTSAPTGAGPAQSPAQQPPLHLAPTPSEAEAAGSQT